MMILPTTRSKESKQSSITLEARMKKRGINNVVVSTVIGIMGFLCFQNIVRSTSSCYVDNSSGMISPTTTGELLSPVLLERKREPKVVPHHMQCTPEQLQVVASQFSLAKTRCPKTTWFDTYVVARRTKYARNDFLSVYVGCNKAFDAINTMRMATQNPVFDKNTWGVALQAANGGHGTGKGAGKGSCGQENTPQFEILQEQPLTNNHSTAATMHCIEAMPVTASVLKTAASELKLGQQGFHVVHAALSRQDGVTRFPKVGVGVMGEESKGISFCETMGVDKRNSSCVDVPMYSLDSFVEKEVQDGIIHFLSIDVEGYDYDVLMGGGKTLKRVEYLEFEYHIVGNWAKHPVTSATDPLNWLGFTCYWAGVDQLWRITDCYHPKYEAHGWSNVACANRNLAPELAKQMEQKFLKTIGFDNPEEMK